MILISWTILQLLTGAVAASSNKLLLPKSHLPSVSNNATSPFRTINYITHSLPQQCLATNYYVSDQNEQEALQGSPAVGNVSDTEASSSQPIGSSSIPVSVIPPASSSKATSDEIAVPASTRSTIVPDAVPTTPHTPEEDSALESGNFLSFEDWKKQNLKKAGQSEHVGSGGSVEFREPRKRPVNVQNALDSLGDDAEIDIDFTGFVSGGPEKGVYEATHPIAEIPEGESSEIQGNVKAQSRSKDAGTTCKERFNYASFDCAANILKTNREAKSSNAILLENKDSYMLNKCAAKDKFIILELCDDIQIDTIVIANFEFFSSTFRTFRVSVSDRYPVKVEKWKSLGVYEARNTREVQAFLVENPLIWARYVRLEFLTHYGKEFYCPVSLVRVHGTTMMEEYKHDTEERAEDENEDDSQASEDVPIDDLVIAEPIPIPPGIPSKSLDESQNTPPPIAQETTVNGEIDELKDDIQVEQIITGVTPPSVAAYEAISAVIDPSDTCVPKDSPIPTDAEQQDPIFSHSATSDHFTVKQSASPSTVMTNDEKLPQTTSIISSTSKLRQSTTGENPSRSLNQTKSVSATSQKPDSSTASPPTASVAKERASSSANERSRQSSTPSQPFPAAPTIQESFFKTVQKRLQMLEANSSLSLQYIEDQSRALRDAFKKVEQRQLTKTTAFLEQLNSTVLNELREFRQQYDQLWQSTIIELEIQRERYERDSEAINARLGLLADEVIFQRRMGLIQMVLILVCLVLVLFSRGSINNYLELPLVQNVLSKSPSTKWLNLSNRGTPVRSLKAGRAYGTYQSRNGVVKTHRRMQSEDSITDTQSGPEAYIPLTPVSYDAHSDVEYFKDEAKSPTSDFDQGDSAFDDPEFDPSTIERPSTSPPVLRVNELSPVSEVHHTSDRDAHELQLLHETTGLSSEFSNGLIPAERQSGDLDLIPKHLSWDLPVT